MTRRNSSGCSLRAGTAQPTPALLISTSTLPKWLRAASTSAVHCAGSLTSVATGRARRPAPTTCALTLPSRSVRRAPSTTSAPACASATAKPAPRPELAPVTTATFPSSRNKSSTPAIEPSLLSWHLRRGSTVASSGDSALRSEGVDAGCGKQRHSLAGGLKAWAQGEPAGVTRVDALRDDGAFEIAERSVEGQVVKVAAGCDGIKLGEIGGRGQGVSGRSSATA